MYEGDLDKALKQKRAKGEAIPELVRQNYIISIYMMNYEMYLTL